MSVITYQCGCQTNGVSMLGMCLHHAMELQTKERESEKRYEEMHRAMRAADQVDEVQK